MNGSKAVRKYEQAHPSDVLGVAKEGTQCKTG